MILRSASLLTAALGLRVLLATLPALGGALVLPLDEVADITLALAIVTPLFLASAMGIPQRISTGDYGAGRYDQLHLARLLLALGALPLVLLVSLGFPVLATGLVLTLFAVRLFEGQAEVSTAILTRHDRPNVIAMTYAVLVALYLLALVYISNVSHGRLGYLLTATVLASFTAMLILHMAARKYHDRTASRERLMGRALFEIRKGYSLGFANGLLSLVSYLPRYLLSAIGLHILQGAFAITQLLIRQFTIVTQGLLFSRGGALLPRKGSKRAELDRFLLLAASAASLIALTFTAIYLLVRESGPFQTVILAELDAQQTMLSILVGAIFLLRFTTWLLATRFLKGPAQLRIALWSTAAALVTASLLLMSPRFEIALATDIAANLVIILLARRAIRQTVAV